MLGNSMTSTCAIHLLTQLSMSRICSSFTLWRRCLPPNTIARERSILVNENAAQGEGRGPVVSGELQVPTVREKTVSDSWVFSMLFWYLCHPHLLAIISKLTTSSPFLFPSFLLLAFLHCTSLHMSLYLLISLHIHVPLKP